MVLGRSLSHFKNLLSKANIMLQFVLLVTLLFSPNLVVAPPPRSNIDLVSSILSAGDVVENNNPNPNSNKNSNSNPNPNPNPKPSVLENYVRGYPLDGLDSPRKPTVTPSYGGYQFFKIISC